MGFGFGFGFGFGLRFGVRAREGVRAHRGALAMGELCGGEAAEQQCVVLEARAHLARYGGAVGEI